MILLAWPRTNSFILGPWEYVLRISVYINFNSSHHVISLCLWSIKTLRMWFKRRRNREMSKKSIWSARLAMSSCARGYHPSDTQASCCIKLSTFDLMCARAASLPWMSSGRSRCPSASNHNLSICRHGTFNFLLIVLARVLFPLAAWPIMEILIFKNFYLVPGERLELSRITPHDFESCASTSSATRAMVRHERII